MDVLSSLDILESSDTWRKGLRIDDEIIELAGKSVRSVNSFKNILGTLPAGWRIPVVYRREGRPTEIFVELAGVHTPAMLNELMAGRRGKPSAKNKPGDKPKPNPLAPDLKDLPETIQEFYERRFGYANFSSTVLNLNGFNIRSSEESFHWKTKKHVEIPRTSRSRWLVWNELNDQSCKISLPTGISRWEQVVADAGLAAEPDLMQALPALAACSLRSPYGDAYSLKDQKISAEE